MGDFYTNPVNGTARTTGKCVWCGEAIAAKDKQVTQSGCFYGEMFRNRYHPECWGASCRMMKLDRFYMLDGFEPHSFTRGCICERGSTTCGHTVQEATA